MPILKVYVCLVWGDYRFRSCGLQRDGDVQNFRYRAQGCRTCRT